MRNIIDKLVAIPADMLEEAEAWIGSNCGSDKVVMPVPVGAWARIVFRSKRDGFMWRMRSDGGWSRDGSRAVAVVSGHPDHVAALVQEAHRDLRHVEAIARVKHWLIAKCEFTNETAAVRFTQEFNAMLLS